MRQYFSYPISEITSVRESFYTMFSEIRHSTGTVRYGTIRYDRLTMDSGFMYNTVLYGIVPYRMVMYFTVSYRTVKRSNYIWNDTNVKIRILEHLGLSRCT